MSVPNDGQAVATIIRTARKRAGLTQEQLAHEIGAHRDSISNWETGKHRPDGYVLQLEEALNITLSEGEEADRVAEAYTLEALLDRLRAAEREIDRARTIARHLATEGQD